MTDRSPAAESAPTGDRRFEIVLFLVSLCLRLAYALPRAVIPDVNDMGVYDQLATSLLAGGGYVSQLEPHFQSFRAPGYPFFLVALYALFGHRAEPVAIAQSLLGATSVVLVHRLGRACFDPRAGRIAALLCAINPDLLHWTPHLLTETLYIALVLVFLLMLVRMHADFSWRLLWCGALAAGAANLVRPVLFPVLALAAAALVLWTHGSPSRRLARGLAFVSLALLVLVPWTLRNYRVHDRFVSVATISGISLFDGIVVDIVELQGQPLAQPAWRYLEQGLHQLPNGYRMMPELFGHPPTTPMPDDFDEVEQSRGGQEIFFRYARAQPLRMARLIALKVSMAFNPLPKAFSEVSLEAYGFGRADVLIRWVSALFWFASFALGALGCIRGLDFFGPRTFLFLFLLFHVAAQTLSLPSLRYFLPGLVAASPFVGAGAVRLADRIRRKEGTEWRPGELATWAVLVAVLVANTWYQLAVLRQGHWQHEIERWQRLLG